MCGICGGFSVDATPPDWDWWEQCADAMWRRGPDDRGVVADEHTVLANRRLSVMDPRDVGHLPMESRDGRFALAFNGELYNFRELRDRLTARGHRFDSHGDSEVLLAALVEWGTGALDRLNGMFALAFHDRTRHELLLARDHAGIKPLYVLEDPRGLVFASEYDVCFRHPWADGRSADPAAVAAYLRWGHVPAPLGHHRGVGMLPAGSWTTIDASGRRRSRRYCRGPAGIRARHGGPRPSAEEVDAVLSEAVGRQTVADRPVGSLLSGGVDSPLIAALHTELSGGPVHTFSVAMADPLLDESADARIQATALASRHHTTRLDEQRAGELFEQVVDATHEPLADEGIFPTLAVMELAAEHVTVVLSGEGGDELFWGYVQRQLDAVRGRPGGYAAAYLDASPAAFTACFPHLPVVAPDGPELDLMAGDPGGRAQLVRDFELEHYLGFILLKADRASMYHSIEQRVPLLDRAVVELAGQLDWTDCVDTGSGLGKLPLRRALRAWTEHVPGPKRGFTAPIGSWLRTSLRDRAEESLSRLDGLETVEVDTVALAALWQRHLAGRSDTDEGMLLFRLVMLDQWLASLSRRVGASP
jgi:asparagine synthase (glutamine-hydrolysing)